MGRAGEATDDNLLEPDCFPIHLRSLGQSIFEPSLSLGTSCYGHKTVLWRLAFCWLKHIEIIVTPRQRMFSGLAWAISEKILAQLYSIIGLVAAY